MKNHHLPKDHAALGAPFAKLNASERLDALLGLVGLCSRPWGEICERQQREGVAPEDLDALDLPRNVLRAWTASAAPSLSEHLGIDYVALGRDALMEMGVGEAELRPFGQDGSIESQALLQALPVLFSGAPSGPSWAWELQNALADRESGELRMARYSASNNAIHPETRIAHLGPNPDPKAVEAWFLLSATKNILFSQARLFRSSFVPPGRMAAAFFIAARNSAFTRDLAEAPALSASSALTSALRLFSAIDSLRGRQTDWPDFTGGDDALFKSLSYNEHRPCFDRAAGELTAQGLVDDESSAWLLRETQALEQAREAAISEFARLCFTRSTLCQAFAPHVALRMRSPFQSLLKDGAEKPLSAAEAFPSWRPRDIEASVAAIGEAAPAALSAKVEREARKQGPLGELAANAARVYGLSASDANALIGEAKRALSEEAGWSAGVWRLAANNPEFATACAASLAEQIKAAKKKERSFKASENRKISKNAIDRAGAVAARANELAERLQQEGMQFERWLFDRKQSANANVQARAMMAVGQAAVESGGLGHELSLLARLVSSNEVSASRERADGDGANRGAQLTLCLLAGAPAGALGGIEGAFPSVARLRQFLQEQSACAERSGSLARAFAEGLGRAHRDLEQTNPQATPQELEAAARSVFLEQMQLLRDCAADNPGFIQALPKKTTWGALMGMQRRWHEAMLTREFEQSGRGGQSWEAALPSCSEGAFSATPLASARDLFEEGRAMHHCVFSYADRCLSGVNRIVSIRKNGARVATMELTAQSAQGNAIQIQADGSNAHEPRAWSIVQNQGPCNAKLTDPALLAFCDAYVAEAAAYGQRLRDERALARGLSPKAPSPKGKRAGDAAPDTESTLVAPPRLAPGV
jgi:hypothetical protein